MRAASLCAAASGLSVNILIVLRLQVAPAGFLQRPEQRRVNKRAACRRRTPPPRSAWDQILSRLWKEHYIIFFCCLFFLCFNKQVFDTVFSVSPAELVSFSCLLLFCERIRASENNFGQVKTTNPGLLLKLLLTLLLSTCLHSSSCLNVLFPPICHFFLLYYQKIP